jgi:hypothetical protein
MREVGTLESRRETRIGRTPLAWEGWGLCDPEGKDTGRLCGRAVVYMIKDSLWLWCEEEELHGRSVARHKSGAQPDCSRGMGLDARCSWEREWPAPWEMGGKLGGGQGQ